MKNHAYMTKRFINVSIKIFTIVENIFTAYLNISVNLTRNMK